jgi:hypothetical protein
MSFRKLITPIIQTQALPSPSTHSIVNVSNSLTYYINNSAFISNIINNNEKIHANSFHNNKYDAIAYLLLWVIIGIFFVCIRSIIRDMYSIRLDKQKTLPIYKMTESNQKCPTIICKATRLYRRFQLSDTLSVLPDSHPIISKNIEKQSKLYKV